MIPRYKFLYGVWRRASWQVLLSSRSNCQPDRALSFASTISPKLAADETPLEAVKYNGFAPAEHGTDSLEKSIKAAKTTSEILAVLDQHANIMDHYHLLGCMRKLVNLAQEGIFAEILADSDAFQKALEIITLRINRFRKRGLLDLIVYMEKLNVAPTAPIIETICSELRFNLNDPSLTLQDLQLLAKILPKLSTPSVCILKHTVPVAIQFRIKKEFDVEDKNACFSIFDYMLVNEVDVVTSDFIAEATLRQCRSFSYEQAATLLQASVKDQLSRRTDPKSLKIKEVLTTCLGIVTENMKSIPPKQLKTVVKALRWWPIGTDKFFTGAWRKTSKWSSKELLDLLAASALNNFMTLPVANQVVAWYLSQHKEIAPLTDWDHYSALLATAFATSAIHTAAGTEENEQALKAAQLLMDFVVDQGIFLNGNTANLADFLTQMCVCGIYPWHYLDEVFHPASQERNSVWYRACANLQHLEEMVAYKLKDSSRYKVRPESAIFRHRTLRRNISQFSVKSLRNSISSFANSGEQEFIRTRRTLSHLNIDFIIAFGRNGTVLEIPGALRGLLCLEELPPESKVVAIVLDTETHFSTGLTRPWCEWKLRRLRDEGMCPVVLETSTRGGMPEVNLGALIQEAFREGPVYSKPEVSDDISSSLLSQ